MLSDPRISNTDPDLGQPNECGSTKLDFLFTYFGHCLVPAPNILSMF